MGISHTIKLMFILFFIGLCVWPCRSASCRGLGCFLCRPSSTACLSSSFCCRNLARKRGCGPLMWFFWMGAATPIGVLCFWWGCTWSCSIKVAAFHLLDIYPASLGFWRHWRELCSPFPSPWVWCWSGVLCSPCQKGSWQRPNPSSAFSRIYSGFPCRDTSCRDFWCTSYFHGCFCYFPEGQLKLCGIICSAWRGDGCCSVRNTTNFEVPFRFWCFWRMKISIGVTWSSFSWNYYRACS